MHGGYSRINGDGVEMNLKNEKIFIPIRREQANLPIVFDSYVTTKQKNEVGLHIRYAMAYSNLLSLHFFVDLQISSELIKGNIGYEDMVKTEFEHYTQLCGPFNPPI